MDSDDTAKKQPRKRGRPKGPARDPAVRATEARATALKRKTAIEDLLSLHSTVMRSIQLMTDRLAGLELHLANLHALFDDLPGRVDAIAARVEQIQTAIERAPAPAAPEPTPAPSPPPPDPPEPQTFAEVCCALYGSLGRPVGPEDGPALVQLFDRVANTYNTASSPEHVEEFLAVATRQSGAPRYWNVQDIDL